MNAKRVIASAALMRPIAHFSHAVRVGELIHVGATAGTDAARRLAGATPGLADSSAQMRRMLDNLDTVLELLGARREHVVRVKSYLADVRDLARYADIFRGRFERFPPAHAIVGSAGFPLPQAAVELDAVAIAGSGIERLAGGAVLAGARHYCTAHSLAHLSILLKAAGLAASDVVHLHVTLAGVRSLATFESEFQQFFRPPYPARTLVAAPLPLARMPLQLESTAQRGGGRAVGAADLLLGCASRGMLAGDELFLSGQPGGDAQGRFAEGAEAQTRAAFGRIAAVLSEANMGLADVLRTNNTLVDWRDYGDFNKGYGANVASPYPPRTTVVAGLIEPGAVVQTEAIAHARASEALVLDAPGDTQDKN